MSFAGFPAATTRFLAELSQNNERAWFDAHSGEYERVVLAPAQELVTALGAHLRELDPKIQAIPRVRGSIKAVERRQRRFTKTPLPPYKDSLDLWFWSGRRRAWDNSGFFLRLTPTRLILAGGMIEFQKGTLERYRDQVLDAERGEALGAIVRELEASGYVVGGESYKRTPRGVPPDHPRAPLLRHSGLFATWNAEHPEALTLPSLVDFVYAHFTRMAKLHTWLVALHPTAEVPAR